MVEAHERPKAIGSHGYVEEGLLAEARQSGDWHHQLTAEELNSITGEALATSVAWGIMLGGSTALMTPLHQVPGASRPAGRENPALAAIGNGALRAENG